MHPLNSKCIDLTSSGGNTWGGRVESSTCLYRNLLLMLDQSYLIWSQTSWNLCPLSITTSDTAIYRIKMRFVSVGKVFVAHSKRDEPFLWIFWERFIRLDDFYWLSSIGKGRSYVKPDLTVSYTTLQLYSSYSRDPSSWFRVGETCIQPASQFGIPRPQKSHKNKSPKLTGQVIRLIEWGRLEDVIGLGILSRGVFPLLSLCNQHNARKNKAGHRPSKRVLSVVKRKRGKPKGKEKKKKRKRYVSLYCRLLFAVTQDLPEFLTTKREREK